jgi:Transcription factor Iwr1
VFVFSVQPVDLADDGLDEGDEDQDGNESEDSNEESNWRNDYPDEDDGNCFESADSDEGEEFHGWNISRFALHCYESVEFS